MSRPAFVLALLLFAVCAVTAQNDAQKSVIKRIEINADSVYYVIYYVNLRLMEKRLFSSLMKKIKKYSSDRAITILHSSEEEPKPPCGIKRSKNHE